MSKLLTALLLSAAFIVPSVVPTAVEAGHRGACASAQAQTNKAERKEAKETGGTFVHTPPGQACNDLPAEAHEEEEGE